MILLLLAVLWLASPAQAQCLGFQCPPSVMGRNAGSGAAPSAANCLLVSGTTTNCLLISGTTTNALLVR